MNNSPGNNGNSHWEVEQYRSYLLLLAQVQLTERQRASFDASDIVQQSLLEAHTNRDAYRGDSKGIMSWLRKILANNIRDALRFDRREKRDLRRNVSLEEGIERTSQRLEIAIPARTSSPSRQAILDEQLILLSDALLSLPEEQRQAVTLHHLQEWTLREIASHLDKSEAAIAGLLFRGLRSLRMRFPQDHVAPSPTPKHSNQ